MIKKFNETLVSTSRNSLTFVSAKTMFKSPRKFCSHAANAINKILVFTEIHITFPNLLNLFLFVYLFICPCIPSSSTTSLLF